VKIAYCTYTFTIPTNDLTYLFLVWKRAKAQALGEATTRLKRISGAFGTAQCNLQNNRNNLVETIPVYSLESNSRRTHSRSSEV
jgi:hypothetical protein